jgi:hypothetical protein
MFQYVQTSLPLPEFPPGPGGVAQRQHQIHSWQPGGKTRSAARLYSPLETLGSPLVYCR